MLDSYTYSKKHRIYTYLMSNFFFSLLIIVLLVSLIIFKFFDTSASTARVQFVDTQSSSYIEEEFNQSHWYSLVDSIDTADNKTTLNTFIFPDQEGRRLASQIVEDLRTKGVQGEISIYGKNMSKRLLVTSKQ
jgi:hypothetical protein